MYNKKHTQEQTERILPKEFFATKYIQHIYSHTLLIHPKFYALNLTHLDVYTPSINVNDTHQ